MSNMNRRDVVLGFAALLGCWPAAARASNPAAEAHVRKIADEVMRLAASGLGPKPMRARFANLLGRYVNIKSIANFALGPYQKRLPPKERERFYDLVESYSAALFAWYAKDFRGTELQIVSAVKQGSFITLTTVIKNRGQGGEQVKWRLLPSGSGYRVADVNIKNVWLTISMKKRFGDVLNRSKGDFGPLYAELREADTWWQ
jgi:ABC-type transporter MlaC component